MQLPDFIIGTVGRRLKLNEFGLLRSQLVLLLLDGLVLLFELPLLALNLPAQVNVPKPQHFGIGVCVLERSLLVNVVLRILVLCVEQLLRGPKCVLFFCSWFRGCFLGGWWRCLAASSSWKCGIRSLVLLGCCLFPAALMCRLRAGRSKHSSSISRRGHARHTLLTHDCCGRQR